MSDAIRTFATTDAVHPVDVDVAPALTDRNRLTTAFRPILAIPHILLVGGPAAFAISGWHNDAVPGVQGGAGTGVLGAVAAVIALIAWFAIVFGKWYPEGLWALAVYYLRWRVRAIAYLTLLRDEYPPFGDDDEYPARLVLTPPTTPRNRLTVAFRLFLAIPQLIVVAILSVGWAMTTIIAWLSILFTGHFPPSLYRFGVGMLRWTTRVEAYLLLLHDDYPPFSLEPR